MRARWTVSLSVAFLLLFIFLPVVFTHAQTLSELQAQLNLLIQQLNTLQQQVPGTTPNVSSAISCPHFSRALYLGAQGDDVAALQRFLATDPGMYPEAIVSGYFGILTQSAVQRFQARQGIVSSGTPDSTGFGSVGPATRNKISALCGSGPITIPPPQTNCYVGGIMVRPGEAVQLYSVTSVPFGLSCTSQAQVRQCINGVLTGGSSYQYTSCNNTPAINQGCTVGSTSMANGETRTLFLTQLVPYGSTCTPQSRTCTNGVLSGGSGFQYTGCTVSTIPSSCVQDGVAVAHGQSAAFYTDKNIKFGQNCTNFTATRTCNNGTLGGNSTYQYASCSAAAAQSCTYASTTIPHGTDRTFYSVQSVAYNKTCTDVGRSLVGHCNDGAFIIPAGYTFASCTVTPEKTCSLDGITYAGGTSHTFYSKVVASTGHACTEYDQARKCTNGVWSGTATFDKAVCAVTGHAYCRLDTTYVADTKTITAYYQKVVPFGNTCAQYDQVRTCKNGTLSGSYPYASCKVQGASACEINGGSIAHNTSATLYSSQQAPSGETCVMNSQVRSCYNGDLTGDDAFAYKTCTN